MKVRAIVVRTAVALDSKIILNKAFVCFLIQVALLCILTTPTNSSAKSVDGDVRIEYFYKYYIGISYSLEQNIEIGFSMQLFDDPSFSEYKNRWAIENRKILLSRGIRTETSHMRANTFARFSIYDTPFYFSASLGNSWGRRSEFFEMFPKYSIESRKFDDRDILFSMEFNKLPAPYYAVGGGVRFSPAKHIYFGFEVDRVNYSSNRFELHLLTGRNATLEDIVEKYIIERARFRFSSYSHWFQLYIGIIY